MGRSLSQRNFRCTACKRGWHEYAGNADAPAQTACPFCGSTDTLTANSLTCVACHTRLLRPSVDGMCGFCSPLGVEAAGVQEGIR